VHPYPCRDKLPEEVASQVYGDLELLLCTPEPTKLGYKQLHKAAMHGDAPTWAEGLVASEDLEEDALPEELAEVGKKTQQCHQATLRAVPLNQNRAA